MSGADLKRAKRAVRRRVLAARDEMSGSERADRSARIAERVLSLPEVERASTVMAFWAFGSEPDTTPLIEALHARGVRVALPTIVDGDLEPRAFVPGDPVTETSFGAARARGRRGDRPGRDRRRRHAGGRVRSVGRRVGYGGGFYDRFLPKTRDDAARIGIGFDVQLVDDDLPNGHFDLRVDAVVTDAAVVRIERRSMRVAGPSRFVRRRSWRDVEFVSLDFEATGLDFARDVIVSFGVVPVRDGRVVLAEALHQLVDPDVPPSVSSQKMHELRPQDLAGAPRLDQARLALREAIRGRYLLVWYADVEVNFLSAIFGGSAARWRRRTIDVRNLAIEADGAPSSARSDYGYGLTSTAGRLGVPVASPHDALDDALVTAQAFLVLATRLSPGSRAHRRRAGPGGRGPPTAG